MPHRNSFVYNGKKLPSVNEITGVLSQAGLLRWYRKLGFKKADKVGGAAREQGIKLASVLEDYRRSGMTGKISVYNRNCVDNFTKWFDACPYEIKSDNWVEPLLINTIDGYRGSPDLIMHEGDKPILLDDKSKKRFASYNLIMNQHGYAMMDSYEDPETKEIKSLPWTPPIRAFWFLTFHPETGELFPVKHEFDETVYQDFLLCKKMLALNKKAEKYFNERAVLLPTVVSE